MRVALYISPAHTVPPETNSILAPWWLVRDIADGLVYRGHDVTLFGARGSKTKARLIDIGLEPFDNLRNQLSASQFNRIAYFREEQLASHMYRLSQKGSFDIIGVHHPVDRLLPLAALSSCPTVNTLHDPINEILLNFYSAYKHINTIRYVSISNAQRANTDLPFAGTVYNGLRLGEYMFSKIGQGYLLAVGRIRKEKGFTDAIAVAKQLAVTLVISGEYFPQYPDIAAYWEEGVKPHIDGERVIYKGPMPRDEIMALYQKATALLFPIHWEEPFGLVMIEAMACGTPVVAYNRGSVSEIVKDGVTGFIVEPDLGNLSNLGNLTIKKTGIAGLVEAVKRIGEIDRAACRRHVEEHFTVEKMVEGYENVYKKILGGV